MLNSRRLCTCHRDQHHVGQVCLACLTKHVDELCRRVLGVRADMEQNVRASGCRAFSRKRTHLEYTVFKGCIGQATQIVLPSSVKFTPATPKLIE